MCNIKELVTQVKKLGQTFCACTDHGSTSGLWNFQKECKANNIKPILGNEFYYQRENDNDNGHLVILAKNNKGLKNLFKLQEYSFVENFYKKPRIDFETLIKHKEGLIVLTACLASTICQYIMNNEISSAEEWALKLKKEFGEDFYLEVQSNEIPEQYHINKELIRIAKKLDIKFVATNDVHYVHKKDAYPHEILLALQVNKKIDDPKRWSFTTNDFWLKSYDEMLNTFVGLNENDVKTALNTTLEIADKCNAEIIKGKYLPKYYNIPKEETERSLLVKNTMQGARDKNFITNTEYMQEVQHEIDIIDEEGYSGYFLIVADYINTARNNGIVVGDGRGSVCGSKVAYLTNITQVEPKHHGLLFERFMAKGRSPDIDTDFSDQEFVYNDLVNKYGASSVAHISTFGRMTPKAICRKVLSTFNVCNKEISIINGLIPNLCPNLSTAVKQSPQLNKYIEKYKEYFNVIFRLEGTISHESTHAGGIVIYPNLSDYLPIRTRGNNRNIRIIAMDMNELEELGFYKFDVLGLETLPTIKRTLDIIKQTHNIDINLHEIDYDDENVYNMLCEGDVNGVFQLSAQTQKVIEQQPRNFKDLVAINSLIRPGIGDWEEYIARRKGKEWHTHPDRMHYMKETEGVLTYQEQYLLDANTFAGWNIAFADKHIRKNKNILADKALKDKFIQDSLNNDYEKSFIINLWDEICETVAGGYGFNKAHSTSYSMTSYQTAWLKHYYTKEFYASLMSSEKTDGDGQTSISEHIAECKQRNINILPPDINLSEEQFTVTDEGIRYSLSAITGVGTSSVVAIKQLRPISSLTDFIKRREKRHVRKNVVINLIKSGCFDFDNSNRSLLLWRFEMMSRTKKEINEKVIKPQFQFTGKIRGQFEKESLGLYLTIHPMNKFGFDPITSFTDGNICLQGGEIYDINIFNDKRGNEMAFVNINTVYNNIKVIIFSNVWKKKSIQNIIQIGNIIMVKGRKSGNDVLANQIELLKED